MIFLHDCPFKGLGSLPEFLDLTPWCIMQQEDFCNNHWLDSPLHHTVERFDFPLQNAVARFDFPLQNAAVRFDSVLHNAKKRFDSPLHHAAGSQTLILIAPWIWKQIRKKLMNQGPRCVLLMKKNRGGKSHATVPLKRGKYSTAPSPPQRRVWLTTVCG